jgi:hypothetical protein
LERFPLSTRYSALVVEKLERAAARNLVDYVSAVQCLAPDFGAEAIACGGGTAAFLGVDCPLTTVKGAGPILTDEDISAAEEFLLGRGATMIVFELAPWLTSDSIERLMGRGYAQSDSEDLVIQRNPFFGAEPPRCVERVSEMEWPAIMRAVNAAVPDAMPWSVPIAAATAILPDALHFGVRDATGAWIAGAQVVRMGDIAVFANDATSIGSRCGGCQTALIRERLHVSDSLLHEWAIAEVAPGSTSERNYLRCAFQLAYTRTHYARRP